MAERTSDNDTPTQDSVTEDAVPREEPAEPVVRRLRASNPNKRSQPKASEVSVRQVAHPRVWATAIKLAGGDAKLVTVESFARVSVTVRE